MNCEWAEWDIGVCSETCGGGTRTKTRAKTKDESNGGVCDGDTKIEEKCNTEDCPGELI